MDFMNFRILNGFKRTLIFEVSCLLFEISGQRFAKFAVDLNDAIRELGKASLECFRDVLVLRACTHKARSFGNRWLPQTTCADCAGRSGNLLTPSPPAEKAGAHEDQARKSRAYDGAGDKARSSSIADLDARSLGRTRCKVQVVLGIHYTARADRLNPALTDVKWIVRRICECSKGPRCSIKTHCNCNSA